MSGSRLRYIHVSKAIIMARQEYEMLDIIDLDIESMGYDNFISTWLYQGDSGGVFLVDPGPTVTVDHLVSEIKSRGIEKVDLILLTHIHMDHAGGIGDVHGYFPDARVVCHQKAVEHLLDPTRLQEGSVKVLGEVAKTYGKIRPVPKHRIVAEKFIDFEDGITVIPTPGHAAHHQSFVFRDILFCGEMFGVFQDLETSFYLRPATPPRFVMADFLESMDRIRPYADRKLCFGHYGSHPNGLEILNVAKRQLELWVDVIRNHMDQPDQEVITRHLMEEDPVFSRISMLTEQQYQRELYFVGNSIKGISGYLKEKETL